MTTDPNASCPVRGDATPRGNTTSHRRSPATGWRYSLIAALLLMGAQVFATTARAQPHALPLVVLPLPVFEFDASPATVARLVDLFERGALIDEAARQRQLTRWTKEVAITVRGDAAQRYVTTLDALAAKLAVATGREVEVFLNPQWAGDIDIYVTDWPEYWPFFVSKAAGAKRPDDRFTCIAIPWSLQGVMKRSQVHINAGNLDPDETRACLVEEVVQSFGLFGEIDDEIATILNDTIGYQDIGALDRLLLALLYDPRLPTGAKASTVLPHLPDIVADHLTRLPPRATISGPASAD